MSDVNLSQAAVSQGGANLTAAQQQALLNNPNIANPFGMQSWTGPTDGSGRPTLTQTLSPAEQAKLDARNAIQTSALGGVSRGMGNVNAALNGSFGLSGAPVQGFDPRFPMGTTQTALGNAGPIQGGLNFSNSPGLVGTDQATRKAVADATYAQGAQYLDPQFRNLQSDLTTNLANQGITAGSAAYDRAKLSMNQQQQKAYSDLSNSAILGGNTALLQQQQAALGNRALISGETTAGGQFANTAQGQQFAQLLNSLQANNAGVAQQANIAGTSSQLANAGRLQAYNESNTNRTLPVDLYNSLMSGSQVNNPTFQPLNTSNVTPAPLLTGAYNQGQLNAAGASTTAGLIGQGLSAVGTIGSAALAHPGAVSAIANYFGNSAPVPYPNTTYTDAFATGGWGT